MSRAKRWVFTLNNYTDDEVTSLRALTDVEYLIFAKEVGEQGTPHLQGFCVFKTAQRLTTVKNALGQRIHAEVARGSPQQARDYCRKPTTPPDDIYEFGTCPGPQGRRTDLEQAFLWADSFFTDHARPPTTPEVARELPTIATKFTNFTRVVRLRHDVAPREEEVDLYGWQAELNDMLHDAADDRTILFYVDEEGNHGKSWFQRWFCEQNPDDAQMLFPGKTQDVAMVLNESKRVFFFNVARGQMEYLQYQILEQLKDQVVFSPKYHSLVKRLSGPPHVVVFSNELPNMARLSEDRYVIKYLPPPAGG